MYNPPKMPQASYFTFVVTIFHVCCLEAVVTSAENDPNKCFRFNSIAVIKASTSVSVHLGDLFFTFSIFQNCSVHKLGETLLQQRIHSLTKEFADREAKLAD